MQCEGAGAVPSMQASMCIACKELASTGLTPITEFQTGNVMVLHVGTSSGPALPVLEARSDPD